MSGLKSDPSEWKDPRHRLGALGERVARRYMKHHGWTILCPRFRIGHSDIDFVAHKGDVVAFVEVKTRRSSHFGLPEESLTWKKRREIGRLAGAWIRRHDAEGLRYRFDVIGVMISGRRVRVRHIEAAFTL